MTGGRSKTWAAGGSRTLSNPAGSVHETGTSRSRRQGGREILGPSASTRTALACHVRGESGSAIGAGDVNHVQVISEPIWPFRDGSDPYPYVQPETDLGGATRIGIDPFPAYGHDPDLVATTLTRVNAAFPLPEPFAPIYFLLRHETLSRANGQSEIKIDYGWKPPEDDPRDAANQRPWRGLVVLSAKRIGPHPAMTRYLVAHEYGHIVENWLLRCRRERAHSDELILEYADRRGLPPSAFTLQASGGQWHRAAQEIFANDFRLLVTGLEREFWPHPGIERPEGISEIRRWWRAQRRRWAAG